jgi:hypothetical protein
VKAKRSSLKLGNCSKLETRYCGPFEIMERIGILAYMFSLPTSMCIHNVFHVSFLKKYVPDVNLVIYCNVIRVEQEGDFQVQTLCILDHKIEILWNREIGIVKIQWTHYSPKDATWEHEDAMCKEYPHHFF